MAEGLILLIVGAAAAIGGPALAIWLWVRRGSASASARDHHSAGDPADARFDAPAERPSDAAALALTDANLTPDAPSADHDEKSLPEAEHEALAACSAQEARPQDPTPDDELPGPEACRGFAREDCDTIEEDEGTEGAGCAAAESELNVDASAVQADPPEDDLGLGPQAEPDPEPPVADLLTDSTSEETAGDAASADPPVRTRQRRSNSAKHRDRRGQRRALAPQAAPASERAAAAEAALRTPAEAKLRLMLHPIRRTATLSVVLARPAGYPGCITLLLSQGAEVGAYSEDRYDDVDIDWTADLLSAELRLDCEEGYQWLRSGRRIHIFGEVADEPGIMSVGSASLLSPSTIVCRSEDAAAVHAAAQACGSPTLVSHDHWSGIPDGWMVLSGYRPVHAAASGLAAGLTVLDPGVGSEIRLSEGLRIRSVSFAEGCPPRIEIEPFPVGATITIDGRPAELGEDGAWTADGWERPGDHLIDVVPGPSAAYRIIEDPWTRDGWEAWDAHPERFGASAHAPWAVAQVCGGAVSGPGGEYVVAANAMLSVVCLGLRRGVVVLRGRPDAPVAVGLLGVPPAFLISASGRRRKQGRIAWLSPFPAASGTRTIDPQWVAEVRSASARRLPLDGGGAPAEDAWRKARERARRHKRPRS